MVTNPDGVPQRGMLQVARTNLERQLEAAREALAAVGVMAGPVEVHGDGSSDASLRCALTRAGELVVLIDVAVFIDVTPAAPIGDIVAAFRSAIERACAA